MDGKNSGEKNYFYEKKMILYSKKTSFYEMIKTRFRVKSCFYEMKILFACIRIEK